MYVLLYYTAIAVGFLLTNNVKKFMSKILAILAKNLDSCHFILVTIAKIMAKIDKIFSLGFAAKEVCLFDLQGPKRTYCTQVI